MQAEASVSSIFPKWANAVPVAAAVGLGAVSVGVVGGVYYYFTPEYWEVGYQPEQPVGFSHQIHAGQLGIDCRYCHTHVEEAGHSNVPTTSTCMNCHGGEEGEWSYFNTNLATAHFKNADLKTLREAYAEERPVEWAKIHKLPDYAHFNHAVHVNAGVSCYSCHGRIDQMEVVYQAHSLSMAWCLDCHRNPGEHLIDNTGILQAEGGLPGEAVRVTDLGAVERLLQSPDQIDRGMKLVQAKQLQPPQHCVACHY